MKFLIKKFKIDTLYKKSYFCLLNSLKLTMLCKCLILGKRGKPMKRFLMLVAGAALLTGCETASQIDAAATSDGGTSVSSSGEVASSSASPSSSTTSSSSSGSTSSSQDASASDGSTSYQYDTDPKTALIKIGDRILFDYDSHELDEKDRQILIDQADFLKQNPALKITIEGHCDERGTREYNLALGEKRANSAKDYLIALGINSARIKIVSYGKERPQVLGSNKAAWQMNRRAVTTLN